MRPHAPHHYSAAAERNRGPILTELQRLLPPRGRALEIAGGSGQHAAHFAAGLPGWCWQSSDGDAQALPSHAAWCAGLPNVLPALHLDVLATPWAGVPGELDLVFSANLLHISPWATCAALMQGAACHLAATGLLLTYGPYVVDGEAAAPSNLAFDAELRARNPQWGLRTLGAVAAQAGLAGLHLCQRIDMPANNLMLVWARGSTND